MNVAWTTPAGAPDSNRPISGAEIAAALIWASYFTGEAEAIWEDPFNRGRCGGLPLKAHDLSYEALRAVNGGDHVDPIGDAWTAGLWHLEQDRPPWFAQVVDCIANQVRLLRSGGWALAALDTAMRREACAWHAAHFGGTILIPPRLSVMAGRSLAWCDPSWGAA